MSLFQCQLKSERHSESVCMVDGFKLVILIWKWILIGFGCVQFGGMCSGPMMRLMKLISPLANVILFISIICFFISLDCVYSCNLLL